MVIDSLNHMLYLCKLTKIIRNVVMLKEVVGVKKFIFHLIL
jgi:hypothetical protein